MVTAKACSVFALAALVSACQGGAGQPTATAEAKASGSDAAATSPSKSAECSALIGVVNRGLAELEDAQKKAKVDPGPSAELRSMSSAMTKAALAASRLTLATKELKAFAARYQTMCEAAAKHATAVADAADKKALDRLQQVQKELNETLALEDPLIDELNKFCSSQ